MPLPMRSISCSQPSPVLCRRAPFAELATDQRRWPPYRTALDPRPPAQASRPPRRTPRPISTRAKRDDGSDGANAAAMNTTIPTSILCLSFAARFHGIDVAPVRLVHDHAINGSEISQRLLMRIAKEIGL